MAAIISVSTIDAVNITNSNYDKLPKLMDSNHLSSTDDRGCEGISARRKKNEFFLKIPRSRSLLH